jgi:hypothetical protein
MIGGLGAVYGEPQTGVYAGHKCPGYQQRRVNPAFGMVNGEL